MEYHSESSEEESNSQISGELLHLSPQQTEESRPNLGRRKVRNEKNWKRNINKLKKDSGKSYISTTGSIITDKQFKYVAQCCTKLCFQNVTTADQCLYFHSFWKTGQKDVQDNIIKQSLIGCKPKRRISDCKYSERQTSWKYQININGTLHDVCRQFFLGVLQVSPKRVRVIQQKINNGDIVVSDKRGKHLSRPSKIKESVWKMVEDHWESIPNTPSHYCAEKSKLRYFDNPDLDIKTLFEQFKIYFKDKTGCDLQMKYATYHRNFREKSKYALRMPRTDVCDFCFKCNIILKENPNDPCKVQHDIHMKKVDSYKAIKKVILDKCKTDDSLLVLEFDFAQNRPLPKLEVNSVFYKRLLWMYIFNVHCHNDDNSAMYWFLESKGEKNCNAVCSFLYDFIGRRRLSSVKKIVLFSDATGGQNKSIKVVSFLAWLSKELSVEIEHVYPVRGHSYCVCDRNFGLYSQKMKRVQTIETVDVYVTILKECRSKPFPFDVIHGDCLLKNFYSMLKPHMFKHPKTKKATWTIQKYPRIKYKQGVIQSSLSYFDTFTPFKLIKNNATFEEMHSEPKVVTMNPAKIKDLRALMDFCSSEARDWFQVHVFASQPA